VILDVAIWAVPTGIIGARLYHVITSPEAYFGEGGSSIKAFKIWEGGLGIWGGIAAGASAPTSPAAGSTCLRDGRRHLAVGLPVAQGDRALGQLVQQRALRQGDLPALGPEGLQLGPQRRRGPGGGRRPDRARRVPPTFLYEFCGASASPPSCGYADRRYSFGRAGPSRSTSWLYYVGRFWIELLRIDDAHHFLGMRLNNWTAIVVFVAALVYFLRYADRRSA
jgi:prolipoprotein diacylglyceryltransferase